MIVQAPDNKTIDFGNMPPDQVQSAMQNLYPVSGNQPTGQMPTNGQQAAPANSAQLGNNQVNTLQGLSDWANSPTNVDLSSLPQSGEGLNFAQKLGFGANAIGRGLMGTTEDSIVKPAMRGLTGLVARSNGYIPPNTDSGPDPNTLSPDEMSALTLMSPTSVALASKMGFGAANQSEPIGNKLINYTSQPTQSGDIEDAAFNQLMAPSTGVKPGSSLMAGFKARGADDLNQAASDFKSSGGDLYKQMADVRAVLKPEAATALSSNVSDALKQNLFIPQLNPKTLGIVQHLQDAIDTNGGIGLQELDQYRRLLGRVGNTEDGVSAGMVRRAIDDTVNSSSDDDWSTGSKEAVDLLNQGRSTYAAASRFEDVADVLAKANGDPNKIKQGLTSFLKNDDNTRGWNDDQLDALRYAANTGIGENILKAFGKFGFDFSKSGTGNTVLPAFATMAGAAGTPLGIPLAVGGTIARQAQKYMARGKGEQLLNLLQNGNSQ